MSLSKLELINEINNILRNIESDNLKTENIEWYLRNNLIEYLDSVKKANSRIDLENATKLLDRFCLEGMDWDNKLFKKCSELTSLGLKISKLL